MGPGTGNVPHNRTGFNSEFMVCGFRFLIEKHFPPVHKSAVA
jgi:hypothetical protein